MANFRPPNQTYILYKQAKKRCRIRYNSFVDYRKFNRGSEPSRENSFFYTLDICSPVIRKQLSICEPTPSFIKRTHHLDHRIVDSCRRNSAPTSFFSRADQRSTRPPQLGSSRAYTAIPPSSPRWQPPSIYDSVVQSSTRLSPLTVDQ